MSSEEREMILQMLAENKISTAEAADLLDALESPEESRSEYETEVESAFYNAERSERDGRRAERDLRRAERDMEREARRMEREVRRSRHPGSGRSIVIDIRDGEETKTHIQVPLGMALAAGKFIPKKARAYFDEYGIDVTDLIDSVASDVSQHGDLVNIRDGDKRVQISVVGGGPPEPRTVGRRGTFESWRPEPPEAPEAPQPPEAPEPPNPPPDVQASR
ncbi:MAG TPA: hypothetical protein VG815_19315 [Chloroflexota bacterium]|nr:hypothetical protein [Chloroflexota bacterium]